MTAEAQWEIYLPGGKKYTSEDDRAHRATLKKDTRGCSCGCGGVNPKTGLPQHIHVPVDDEHRAWCYRLQRMGILSSDHLRCLK